MRPVSFKTIYHLKMKWEIWDTRILILFSFFLQIVLVISAPLRKRTSSRCIIVPIWLAYVLANAIANFTVGVIANIQSQDDTDTSSFSVHADLLALWTSLLLVHLGGPDAITAFAVEDNELWLRHLLQLAYQGATSTYVFMITLPMSKLCSPTLLMFVCGFIKYAERTRSLYLASSRKFQRSLLTEPDPGPNYPKVVEASWLANGDTDSGDTEIEISYLAVVKIAYELFNTFQGLIVDMTFGSDERDQSREFFLNSSAREAIKVVEVELNFFYTVLYTKARIIQGMCGYLLRFISFTLNMSSLLIFHFTDKKGFHNLDVGITYTLLLGAVISDMIAFLVVLFSDWNAVELTKYVNPPLFSRILRKLLNVNRKRSYVDSNSHFPCSFGWWKQIVYRRWSRSISQFNLIHYSLHPRSNSMQKFISMLGLTDMLDGFKYVDTVEFPDALGDFIFNELRLKSSVAIDVETSKKINSSRGNWALQCEGCIDLLEWICEVDFDKSLLMWHIATEICLQTEASENDDPEDGNANSSSSPNTCDLCRFSKFLSDYMLYLLIMNSTMMSEVTGIGLKRFRDTYAEAKQFLDQDRGQLGTGEGAENIPGFGSRGCKGKNELDEALHRTACERIHGVDTTVKPVHVKGHKSKSVLFDGCILAKELNKTGEERRWKIMSRVWVEMLSYAAGRCRARIHAAQLNQGGQLMTLVWLLMDHFGLGSWFIMDEVKPNREKRIVGQ